MVVLVPHLFSVRASLVLRESSMREVCGVGPTKKEVRGTAAQSKKRVYEVKFSMRNAVVFFLYA